MTEVCVTEEQLQLVNIIEVSQSKLIKNFTLILRRLDEHQKRLLHQKDTIDAFNTNCSSKIHELQQKVDERFKLIQEQNLAHEGKSRQLENVQTFLKIEMKEKADSIKKINDQLFNTQLQFEEKINLKQQELTDLNALIQKIMMKQTELNDEVNTKESKTEAEKLLKELEVLKDKNNHIENELKLAQHKIEKIQILNQKAERAQAKKDIQIIKQIEERIKKQIKVITNAPNSTPNSRESASKPLSTHSRENDDPQIQSKRGSISYSPSKDDIKSDFIKNNIEATVQKYADKVKVLEILVKQLQQNLKVIAKNSNSIKKSQGKEACSDGINERINEIKPQMIKLWAKLDTIDDRLGFNQRKLDQKLRTVNQLANLIKENNMGKLEEKIKVLQTQIFTNLKEIRAKIESKVNIADYQKYCMMMEDRITQINELIYLKSDKLEVKKALLFLESKIKQIILVISQDEENEKDALLTKKQLKCMSCDKEFDKFNGVVSSPKGNWDSMPYKDHPPQILGRFGMTNFGSLAKKIKKLENKDLPILNKKHNPNQSFQNSP